MSPLIVLLVCALFLGGGEATSVPQRFVIRGTWRAEVGDTVTWSCYFFARPAGLPLPTFYEWVKDGKVILGETQVNLTFKSMTTKDTGIYQCGDSRSNIIRLKHDLYVSGAPLPQPFIRYEGIAVQGRSFFLECLILKGYTQGNKTRYIWHRDGTEIKGQSNRLLQFERVNETAKGAYTCTAREGPVESTSPPSPAFHLTPLMSPEVLIKSTSSNDVIKGILGENLTLTCDVIQAFPWVPEDGFKWSYLPSSKESRQPLVGKGSTLTLGPLTRENGGQYFCQARNDQDFNGLNLIGNASVTVDIVYLQNITLTSDLEVNEGDSVTLTCSVDSRPEAHLVWIVHGQEVRHVADNLDHFVIPTADCFDSTSYTCRAYITDMPGQEISATSKVLVHCKQAPTTTSDTNDIPLSAKCDFWLPDKTSMAVVHPSGQDILTVQQDCSFNISSAFLPRCLDPRCDPARRHLSFTLTRVTEEDEGNYMCKESETTENQIPSCTKRLQLKRKEETYPQETCNYYKVAIAALVIVVILVILIVVNMNYIKRSKEQPVKSVSNDNRHTSQGGNAPEEPLLHV